MEHININFYNIKKIKDFFIQNEYQVVCLVQNDNQEVWVKLNEYDAKIFWGLYYKLK